MNYAVVLAVVAGLAVAVQVVFNVVGLRVLGPGVLVGLSGLATAVAGFVAALFLPRPELAGRAVLYALVSGLLGAFILTAITLASTQVGAARAFAIVIGSQLLAALIVDRLGLLGPAAGSVGPKELLGVALVLAGGLLLVRG